MVRHLSLRAALVAVAAAGTVVLTSPPTQATVANDTPLAVTIDQLTPSTIPARGVVRVSGTVTNTDDTTWQTVNVYSFISAEPLTSSAELDAAAASDPSTAVGDRVIRPGSYDTIDEIAPGDSAPFTFTVSRRLLEADSPGVYWFGVHALGENGEGRDQLADGRARTFLPLVPPGRRGRLGVSIAVPLRQPLNYLPDGSLDDLDRWTRTLAPEGRLRSLVDFGAAAGDRPISWVVDPALLNAVRRLADGNPPRSLDANLERGEDDGEDEGETSAADGSPSATVSPEPTATESSADPQAVPPDSELSAEALEAATVARAWLGRLRSAIGPDDEVLALPYGDTDVSAAARHDPEAYQRARARSGTELAGLGVPTTPVVAAPAGYLSSSGVDLMEPEATALVTDKMFGNHPPPVASVGAHRLVVTSSGAVAGGPGPDDPRASLAMRQRLLAEAAVRFLTRRHSALVVMLPPDWVPSSATSFFSGLDASWLRLTSVEGATGGARVRSVLPEQLRYPERQAAAELDVASFSAAENLIVAGQALQNLLTLNNLVSGTVTDQALGSTSYSARLRPSASRLATDRSRQWIDARLAEVQVRAPVAVTLSSSSGRFATTIRNGLDQPVTVSLAAHSDGRLRIDAVPRVDVPANGRASLLLNARTDESGIHDVTLVVTDKRGTPIGSSTELSIRSARVSNVIWIFIGGGLALLFAAIVVRLVRRVRTAIRGTGDDGADGHEPDPSVKEKTDQPAPARAGAAR